MGFSIRKVYERFSFYGESFKIGGDYEFMLRVVHFGTIKVEYIPETLVIIRVDGISSRSVRTRVQAFIEDMRAWRMHGKKLPLCTLLLKRLKKINQWVFANRNKR